MTINEKLVSMIISKDLEIVKLAETIIKEIPYTEEIIIEIDNHRKILAFFGEFFHQYRFYAIKVEISAIFIAGYVPIICKDFTTFGYKTKDYDITGNK